MKTPEELIREAVRNGISVTIRPSNEFKHAVEFTFSKGRYSHTRLLAYDVMSSDAIEQMEIHCFMDMISQVTMQSYRDIVEMGVATLGKGRRYERIP